MKGSTSNSKSLLSVRDILKHTNNSKRFGKRANYRTLNQASTFAPAPAVNRSNNLSSSGSRTPSQRSYVHFSQDPYSQLSGSDSNEVNFLVSCCVRCWLLCCVQSSFEVIENCCFLCLYSIICGTAQQQIVFIWL